MAVEIKSGGTSFLSLLWLLLIAMKIMGYIHWSWFIVVFFPVVVAAGTLAIFGALALLFAGATKSSSKKAWA